MSKIIAIEHMSLDGVFQAPGRADEDPSGGFTHGGWANKRDSGDTAKAIGKLMEGGWAMLAGHATYDDLHESWPVRKPDNPMTKALNGVRKFVVTRNADTPLPWENSTRLVGEAAETVRKLKADHDKILLVFGSGKLIGSLLEARLLDALLLMIHPIILGKGKRLFEGVDFAEMEVGDKQITDKGVVVATYNLPTK